MNLSSPSPAELSQRDPTGSVDLESPRAVEAAIRGILDAMPGGCPDPGLLTRAIDDLVRAFRRDFANPPDFVVYPRREEDIVAALDWCTTHNVAVVPYGGGSSVVGGVEMPPPGTFAGAVSIDLAHLDRVLEIDPVSRAARIQAGVLGPALEDQLRPEGLTLRHFPQSFEYSSLGGWIVTRSSGQQSLGYGRIERLFVGGRRTHRVEWGGRVALIDSEQRDHLHVGHQHFRHLLT